MGGKRVTPPRLTLSELDAAIGAFVAGRYNGRGLVLTGMLGIEKSLACYTQLDSRIGFAHGYRPYKARS